MITGLTLDYFNEAIAKWSGEVQHFVDWTKEYKVRTNWEFSLGKHVVFCDLPFEMQYGIVLQYFKEIGTPSAQDAMSDLADFESLTLEVMQQTLNDFFMAQSIINKM